VCLGDCDCWQPLRLPVGLPAAPCPAALTSGIDRAIRLSTAVAGLAVAGIAAYVSHWPPTRLSGPTETGITARLEPTTIDGLV
jgi:hypothetical protein